MSGNGYSEILKAMMAVPVYLASRRAELQIKGNDLLEKKVLEPLLDRFEASGKPILEAQPDLSDKLVYYLSLLGRGLYRSAIDYAPQLEPELKKAYQN